MKKYLFSFIIFVHFASADVVVNGNLQTPLFPEDNWWNLIVSNAPLDSISDAIITYLGGSSQGCRPNFGAVPIYGMPYGVVPGDTPLVMPVFYYASESDTNAPGRPPGYPIPEEAKTNQMSEGGTPGGGTSGDRHLLLVDQEHRLLFELYATHWNESSSTWECGSGAIFELDTNNRRPEGWTSADAAGLAILPGLIRADEVFVESNINHAIRVTVHGVKDYVYPASHLANTDNNSPIPLGTRFRLKQNVDLSGKSFPTRIIFQALKTYGMIVADTGSDLYLQGTSDPLWDNDVLNPEFGSIKATDFEVIELGWDIPEPCLFIIYCLSFIVYYRKV
jgi:hypothetical protein